MDSDLPESEQAEAAKKVKRIMDRAVADPRFGPAWRAALAALSSATYAGFSNNKTGSKTSLRFTAGKVRFTARMDSHLITNFEKADWRPERLIGEAMWAPISERFGLGALWKHVNDALERAGRPTWYASEAIFDRLEQDSPEFSKLLWSTVRALRDSGEHAGKQDKHRMESIVEELRKALAKALAEGTARDDIVRILDEEVVRAVQDG